ncbi:MAG TPA: metallophosphoesterase [Terriglobales bacterium]|nr:metallophosphoesterase [Terriglobales bacterium]
MSEPQIIRLAIASDLHAFAASQNGTSLHPSHLEIGLKQTPPGQHPIQSLLKLIKEEPLRADALICPGDLGDRASSQGIAYAWSALGRIAGELGCADRCFATAGNHDMDSRFRGTNHAPDHVLKGLAPQFPCESIPNANMYWARSFFIEDCGAFRLVNLNSSAYHGYKDDQAANDESKYGRIDEQALKLLESELAKSVPKDVNVLVCHHSPHAYPEFGLGEADTMRQGQLLLAMLAEANCGGWLVIHGHKHCPRIAYASGASSAPIVFSAGSLCAVLSGQLAPNVKNQFHIIEIRLWTRI